MRSVLIMSLSSLLVSCATVEKSTILGAMIGGTAGGLIGSSAGSNGHKDQATVIGAAVGLGLGSLIGYSAYKDKQKKEQQQALKENPFDSKAPSLTAPKVRRVWVPARIEGDKYIDGHYMYVIEKTSTWSE
jgi:uncharacterized membrane protein YebE (DUF533 family)